MIAIPVSNADPNSTLIPTTTHAWRNVETEKDLDWVVMMATMKMEMVARWIVTYNKAIHAQVDHQIHLTHASSSSLVK